jgi:hypothetical protein
MNQNLASSKYEIWLKLCSQSIRNQYKSLSTKQNLQFLNTIANDIHTQILFQELNGKHIYKLKPSIVFKKISKSHGKDQKENYYQYGHIKINNQPIRLSSCLSFKRQIIQYPIYEQEYLKFGQYTLFTCGDLYLLVINSLLENILGERKTEKGNYEVNISSLFEFDAVYKFGLIDFDNNTFTNENGTHKVTVVLPQKYLSANLKGCITGTEPHFILARLENSGTLDTFDYELWTNYRDIYFAFKKRNNIKQWNAYRLQSDKNTTKLLNKEIWEFTNLVGKAPGIITYSKDVHFMIFNWQKVNNLEEIRKYCHKIYNKYFKNK